MKAVIAVREWQSEEIEWRGKGQAKEGSWRRRKRRQSRRHGGSSFAGNVAPRVGTASAERCWYREGGQAP